MAKLGELGPGVRLPVTADARWRAGKKRGNTSEESVVKNILTGVHFSESFPVRLYPLSTIYLFGAILAFPLAIPLSTPPRSISIVNLDLSVQRDGTDLGGSELTLNITG